MGSSPIVGIPFALEYLFLCFIYWQLSSFLVNLLAKHVTVPRDAKPFAFTGVG